MAAVAGLSQRAERTGDHSPHPSHCRISDWFNGGATRRSFLGTASSTPTRDLARGFTNSADSCGQTWVRDTYRDVCTRAAKRAGRQVRHLEYPEKHEDSEWALRREDRIELEEWVNVEDSRIGRGPWLPRRTS
ncbi:hypothetical protein EDB83DRAFT_2556229 [Lactarius deliciosus]|nr:hypothetical protein EDB83DRAFT_2556229 [Lactarius deliciosus]